MLINWKQNKKTQRTEQKLGMWNNRTWGKQNLNVFIAFIGMCASVCMYVCVHLSLCELCTCRYMGIIAPETVVASGCLPLEVGAGNWTRVLCSNSMHSYQLSQLSSAVLQLLVESIGEIHKQCSGLRQCNNKKKSREDSKCLRYISSQKRKTSMESHQCTQPRQRHRVYQCHHTPRTLEAGTRGWLQVQSWTGLQSKTIEDGDRERQRQIDKVRNRERISLMLHDFLPF